MNENTKEVNFFEFCPICKHDSADESSDPCNECLEHPYNENSKKPVNFAPIDKFAKAYGFKTEREKMLEKKKKERRKAAKAAKCQCGESND